MAGTVIRRSPWSSERALLTCADSWTATEGALWQGLAQAVVGGRLSDIGHAVETHIRSAGGYGIVEEYVGHGIGTSMHMDPGVPNYGQPGHGPELVAGMALAIEPMINLGTRYTKMLADDWTVVTVDGKLVRALRAHRRHHRRRPLGTHRPRRRRQALRRNGNPHPRVVEPDLSPRLPQLSPQLILDLWGDTPGASPQGPTSCCG